MMVRVPRERLLEVLQDIARGCSASAAVEFGVSMAPSVRIGVSYLMDSIRQSLDVGDEPEPEAHVLALAVDRFCAGHCAYSREDPPGTHDQCEACPLLPHTAAALDAQIEHALQDGLV